MDVDEIIASMPKTMQHDIHMHLYAGLIDKVPMFSKTDQAFKLALMNRITSISVQAGFYIFRAHDAASELYFVKQGAVHVMSADETTTFVTLHSGSFFGEIALLEDCTRTATVKTAVDTELCVLSKPDFLAILGQFPAAAELIAQSVREKREADAKRKADEEEKARLRQKEDRADNAVTSLRSRLLGKRPFGSKNALAGESKLTLPGFSSIRRGHRSIVASMRSLTGGGGGGGGGGGAVGSRRQSVFGSKASVFNPPAALASQQTCSNDLTDPEAARAMTDGSSCSISSPSASERYAPKLPSVPVTPPATLKRGQSIATCEASGV
ncbi:cyclic nucleotide-binding-like protein [Catenaria anguillulae PL171]|uniref:Cyclic nucleotide-binding-like protein n=1 Tax=Catenaria anguillulae PL171 TaxID=765915 RepID=A0A1Y2HF41_9FUNG|nr:cyclic nucleotide-binding-like protein [Catenaria anguillulae PL171]